MFRAVMTLVLNILSTLPILPWGNTIYDGGALWRKLHLLFSVGNGMILS